MCKLGAEIIMLRAIALKQVTANTISPFLPAEIIMLRAIALKPEDKPQTHENDHHQQRS